MRFSQQLPYCPITTNKNRFLNARSAGNTIAACRKLGFKPTVLIDVGANESQWSYWLKKEWPSLVIHSFEPQPQLATLGEKHEVALAEYDGQSKLVIAGPSSHLSSTGGTQVRVCRFDAHFSHLIHTVSILKVDAENHTAAALEGFGDKLKLFSLVVVEICGDLDLPAADWRGQQHRIHAIMANAGFNKYQIIDADYYQGNVGVCDVAFWQDGAITKITK